MSVNLLPWRIQFRRQSIEQFYRKLVLSIIAITCVWSVWLSLHVYGIYSKKQKIKALQQSMLQLTPGYMEAKNIMDQYQNKTMRVKQISSYVKQNIAMFDLLDFVGETIPMNMYLISVEKKAEKAYFQGKSLSHADLAGLLTKISNHYLSHKILISASNNLDDSQKLDFILVYDLSAFSP